MRYLAFYLALCVGLFAQSTKVGGSGSTKVGGNGTMKVSPVVPGYLINVQFDSTNSAPSGARFPLVGATDPWATTGITFTWNTTSPVLSGAYCMSVSSSSLPTTLFSFAAVDEAWIYFIFRNTDLSAAATKVHFRDSGGGDLTTMVMRSSGAWRENYNLVETVATQTINTNYYMFFHYKKSSGANDGIISLGFSTNGARPTSGNSFVAATDGNWTSQIAQILIDHDAGNSVPTYFDQFLVLPGATPIPDNP